MVVRVGMDAEKKVRRWQEMWFGSVYFAAVRSTFRWYTICTATLELRLLIRDFGHLVISGITSSHFLDCAVAVAEASQVRGELSGGERVSLQI